jgi:hypothetical protein
MKKSLMLAAFACLFVAMSGTTTVNAKSVEKVEAARPLLSGTFNSLHLGVLTWSTNAGPSGPVATISFYDSNGTLLETDTFGSSGAGSNALVAGPTASFRQQTGIIQIWYINGEISFTTLQ